MSLAMKQSPMQGFLFFLSFILIATLPPLDLVLKHIPTQGVLSLALGGYSTGGCPASFLMKHSPTHALGLL